MESVRVDEQLLAARNCAWIGGREAALSILRELEHSVMGDREKVAEWVFLTLRFMVDEGNARGFASKVEGFEGLLSGDEREIVEVAADFSDSRSKSMLERAAALGERLVQDRRGVCVRGLVLLASMLTFESVHLEVALQLVSESKDVECMGLAVWILLLQHRGEEARKVYSEMAGHHRGCVETQVINGCLLLKERNPDAALAAADEVLGAHGSCVAATNVVAVAHLMRDNSNAASVELESVDGDDAAITNNDCVIGLREGLQMEEGVCARVERTFGQAAGTVPYSIADSKAKLAECLR